MDVGILLVELYQQHSSETAISQGWSKGSLHYSSVESAVSRHLAATSSKLLQKALEIIHTTIKIDNINLKNKKLLVKLLENEVKIEYNLGKLSLYIATEAQRMSYVSCTTTNKIDEIFVIKLQNKAKVARLHGIDLLETILPNTVMRLQTLLTDTTTSTTTNNNDCTLWNNYKKEIMHLILLPTDNTTTSTTTPSTSVHGISITQPSITVPTDCTTTTSILSEPMLLLLNKLTTKKILIDTHLLIAEHYNQQMMEHKIGHINANYIQSMIPPTPTTTPIHSPLPYKSSEDLRNNAQIDTTLPLPTGVQHQSSENLPIDCIPDTSVEASHDKVNNFSLAVQNTMNSSTSSSNSTHRPKNSIYPLLLHTGRQDLVQQLLDRDFLLRQNKLIEKLSQQQEEMRVPSGKTRVLPTPTTPPPSTTTSTTTGTTTSATNSTIQSSRLNPASTQTFDLIFNDELTPQEEEEISNINLPSTTTIPAFNNTILIHSYRQAKKYYELSIQHYIQLFGSDSILAAEVRVYYANLLRCFGFDEVAKPLYELSLKIFKLHNISTYQLPTATTAHCWLGLASYFDIHHTILLPISETKYNNMMNTTANSSNNNSSTNSNNMQYKHKNDLSLRLYEEALNIYKSVYCTTHYNIILTSQSLIPILLHLKQYDKSYNYLEDNINSIRIHLNYTRNIQKYLYNQYRIKKHRLNTRSTLTKDKIKLLDQNSINRIEIMIELNQHSIQTIIYYLGLLLLNLSRINDYNKKYHLSIILYKEAIICFRELRLSIIRRIKKRILLKKQQNNQENHHNNSNYNNNYNNNEINEDVENEYIITNPVERELALYIAQSMRDLSQSLFEEGVKQMGGRKVAGFALPDFQYRHSLNNIPYLLMVVVGIFPRRNILVIVSI